MLLLSLEIEDGRLQTWVKSNSVTVSVSNNSLSFTELAWGSGTDDILSKKCKPRHLVLLAGPTATGKINLAQRSIPILNNDISDPGLEGWKAAAVLSAKLLLGLRPQVVRDVLLLGHRQAFAWVDEWIGR